MGWLPNRTSIPREIMEDKCGKLKHRAPKGKTSKIASKKKKKGQPRGKAARPPSVPLPMLLRGQPIPTTSHPTPGEHLGKRPVLQCSSNLQHKACANSSAEWKAESLNSRQQFN